MGRIAIGIDPGREGAICALRQEERGKPFLDRCYLVNLAKDPGQAAVSTVAFVKEVISDHEEWNGSATDIKLFLEKEHARGANSKTEFGLGRSYGAIIGGLASAFWGAGIYDLKGGYADVQKWQNTAFQYLSRSEYKNDTKKLAEAFVSKIDTSNGIKIALNQVDAICIAAYGLMEWDKYDERCSNWLWRI